MSLDRFWTKRKESALGPLKANTQTIASNEITATRREIRFNDESHIENAYVVHVCNSAAIILLPGTENELTQQRYALILNTHVRTSDFPIEIVTSSDIFAVRFSGDLAIPAVTPEHKLTSSKIKVRSEFKIASGPEHPVNLRSCWLSTA